MADSPKIPPNSPEIARLACLRSYEAIGREAMPTLDELAGLAASFASAPRASVNLMEEDTLWRVGRCGSGIEQIPRAVSFCELVLREGAPVVIPDLAADPRTKASPYVAEGQTFRAYAGVPLVEKNGFLLGTLCVLDDHAREFDARTIEALQALARQAVAQLELRRMNRELERSAAAVAAERGRYQVLVENLREVVFQADSAGVLTYWNPACRRVFKGEPSPGASIVDFAHPDDRDAVVTQLARLRDGACTSFSLEARFRTEDGDIREGELNAVPHPSGGILGTFVDRTSLMHSQRTLRSREDLVQSFFASSPFQLGVVELSEDDLLHVAANPVALASMNIPDGVEQPVSFRRLGIPEENLAFWREKYQHCLRSGAPLRFEYHSNQNGEERWYDATVNFVARAASGNPRFSYTAFDITGSKRLAQTLEKERSILRTVTGNMGDVIWMNDFEKQRIVFVNQAYEQVWGRSTSSLLADGRTFLDGVHPEDRPRVQRTLVQQAFGTYDEIYRVVTPAGEEKWVHDRAFPVKNEAGEVTSVVGIVSDVTALRAQEAANERAKRNLELILSHIPIAVSLFDANGVREWVNQEWERVLGYSASEVVGRTPGREFSASDEVHEQMVKHRTSENVWKEFTTETKYGPKLVSVMMVALPSGKRLSIVRDLTHDKEQAKLIEDQRQKMVESARFSSLGEMAAGIAHEINNPLAIIQGYSQVIYAAVERPDVDWEKVRKSLLRIDTTVTRIAKIISGLKSFARDGSRDPVAPASLRTIIGEALELCQARFRNNDVHLELDLPETDVTFPCRAVQLSQVLLNLLNNAFDAVANEGTKTVRIRLREDDHHVGIAVLDSGPGVPDALREKIMQPFFTTKPPGKGTGIGLSLSRSLVQDHGGTLNLAVDGGMTCFEMHFPKAAGTKAA